MKYCVKIAFPVIWCSNILIKPLRRLYYLKKWTFCWTIRISSILTVSSPPLKKTSLKWWVVTNLKINPSTCTSPQGISTQTKIIVFKSTWYQSCFFKSQQYDLENSKNSILIKLESPDIPLVLINKPSLMLQSQALWFLLFPRQWMTLPWWCHWWWQAQYGLVYLASLLTQLDTGERSYLISLFLMAEIYCLCLFAFPCNSSDSSWRRKKRRRKD